MTGKKRRLSLGRLGDHAPEQEPEETITRAPSMHDEIEIHPGVGRSRIVVEPAPIHEVFGSDEF